MAQAFNTAGGTHHKTVLFLTLKPQKRKGKHAARTGIRRDTTPPLKRRQRQQKRQTFAPSRLISAIKRCLWGKRDTQLPASPCPYRGRRVAPLRSGGLPEPPPRSAAAVPRRIAHGRIRERGTESRPRLPAGRRGRRPGARKVVSPGKVGSGGTRPASDRPPGQGSRGAATGAGIPAPGAERGRRAEDADPYLLMGGDGHVAQRLRSAQLPRSLPRPARRRPRRKRSAAAAARAEEGAQRRARPLPVADRARGGGSAHSRTPSAGAALWPGGIVLVVGGGAALLVFVLP